METNTVKLAKDERYSVTNHGVLGLTGTVTAHEVDEAGKLVGVYVSKGGRGRPRFTAAGAVETVAQLTTVQSDG